MVDKSADACSNRNYRRIPYLHTPRYNDQKSPRDTPFPTPQFRIRWSNISHTNKKKTSSLPFGYFKII